MRLPGSKPAMDSDGIFGRGIAASVETVAVVDLRTTAAELCPTFFSVVQETSEQPAAAIISHAAVLEVLLMFRWGEKHNRKAAHVQSWFWNPMVTKLQHDRPAAFEFRRIFTSA